MSNVKDTIQVGISGSGCTTCQASSDYNPEHLKNGNSKVIGSVISEDTTNNNESINIEFADGTVNEVLDLSNRELSQLIHKNIVKNHNKRRRQMEMEVERQKRSDTFIKLKIIITVKSKENPDTYYIHKLTFSKGIKMIQKRNDMSYFSESECYCPDDVYDYEPMYVSQVKLITSTVTWYSDTLKKYKNIKEKKINLDFEDTNPDFEGNEYIQELEFTQGYVMQSTKSSVPEIELLPKCDEKIILNREYYYSVYNKIKNNLQNLK